MIKRNYRGIDKFIYFIIIVNRKICYWHILLLTHKVENMSDNILNLITSLKMNRVLEQEYMRVNCNLSISEYRGIMSQEKGREMTCMELSEIMGLSPSRSSRVIDNLVRRGYLIRKISTRDRRSMSITLSEKGIEAKEKIKKNQKELEDNLQKRFSDEVINSIKSSLKILLEYFE